MSKPYTRGDVEMVERAIHDVTPPMRDGYVDGRDLLNAEACAVLDALAAAGRLRDTEPVNDIEATGRCCCAGCVGMGPCDRDLGRTE